MARKTDQDLAREKYWRGYDAINWHGPKPEHQGPVVSWSLCSKVPDGGTVIYVDAAPANAVVRRPGE